MNITAALERINAQIAAQKAAEAEAKAAAEAAAKQKPNYSITPYYSGRGYYDVTGADGKKYVYVPKEFVEKGFVADGMQHLNDNFLNPDLLKKASEFKLNNADAITGAAKNLYSDPTKGYVWKYEDIEPYTNGFSFTAYGVSPNSGAITGMSSLNGKPAYAVTTAPGQTASFMTTAGNFTHEKTTITSSGGGGFFGGILGSIATGMKNLVGGVSDVLHGLGEGVSGAVAGLGKGVSDAIHGIGTAIAKDRVLSTAAVIVLSKYIGPQAAAALVSANAGASPENVVKNMVLAGVAQNVAEYVAPQVAGMTGSANAGAAAGQAAGSATSAALAGKDPFAAALTSFATSGANVAAGDIVKDIPGFNNLPQNAQNAVRSAVSASLQGKDPTSAAVGQAMSDGVKEAMKYGLDVSTGSVTNIDQADFGTNQGAAEKVAEMEASIRADELAEAARQEEAAREAARQEEERQNTLRIEQARQEALAEEARQAAALEAQRQAEAEAARQAEEARAAAQAEADRQAELARTQREEEERAKAEELRRLAQEEADRQAEIARQAEEEERRRQEEQQPPPVEPEDKPPPVEVPGEDGGTLTVDPNTGAVDVQEPATDFQPPGEEAIPELEDTTPVYTEPTWEPPTGLPPADTPTGLDNEGGVNESGVLMPDGTFKTWRELDELAGVPPGTIYTDGGTTITEQELLDILNGTYTPRGTTPKPTTPTTPKPTTPTPTTPKPTTPAPTTPVAQQQPNPLGMLALLDVLGQQPQQQPAMQDPYAKIKSFEGDLFGGDIDTNFLGAATGGSVDDLLRLLRS
jgi:hypothetical protein